MSMTIQQQIDFLQAVRDNPTAEIEYCAAARVVPSPYVWRAMSIKEPTRFDFVSYEYRIKPVPRVIHALYNNKGQYYDHCVPGHSWESPEAMKEYYERHYRDGSPFKIVEFVEKLPD